ncbi:MAG: PqqD family protein [Muribaculaceae bacterium]|nr:PqqD family protein [Muribaculaceae bacterium]
MRKIKGFAMRRLGQDAVIVAESPDMVDFDRIVSLNSSAAYVWENLPDTDFNTDDVAEILTDRYDVERNPARKDAEALLATWLSAGIIE